MHIRVSPHVPAVPERIVTLNGPLHGLGRAVAFIAQKLMDRGLYRETDGRGLLNRENFPSAEPAKALESIALRVLVPACKMGYLIGKGTLM